MRLQGKDKFVSKRHPQPGKEGRETLTSSTNVVHKGYEAVQAKSLKRKRERILLTLEQANPRESWNR